MSYKDKEKNRKYQACWSAANPEKKRKWNNDCAKAWRKNHPEEQKIKDHLHYLKQKERSPEKVKKWNREGSKRARIKLKLEVIEAMGGSCVCCGETMFELLTIDHINGGGRKHREEVGNGMPLLRSIRKEGYPKDKYQLLCFNCNCSKGLYGYCPHQGRPE